MSKELYDLYCLMLCGVRIKEAKAIRNSDGSYVVCVKRVFGALVYGPERRNFKLIPNDIYYDPAKDPSEPSDE